MNEENIVQNENKRIQVYNSDMQNDESELKDNKFGDNINSIILDRLCK